MSTKAEVSKETLTTAEISTLCSKFKGVKLPLRETGVLFGGYSGTSIRVTGADGKKAVLKLCHGYGVADAAQQAAVAAHAASTGFTGACAPLPLIDAGSATPCVFERADGTPVMLLSWVEGVAADKVLGAATPSAADALLTSIGSGLAALHSVPVSAAATAQLRACEAGSGACDVSKHMSGELLAKMRRSEFTKAHPFLTEFYVDELAALNAAMTAAELPRGILHGDPFLDNMLAKASSNALVGFVDLEDICLGPLLFDVACCASASCFRQDGALDIGRLRSLLTGYASVRPLSAVERSNFLPFMRLAMLCNATWRFINFNIEHREIASCLDAHVELQERIVALHDGVIEDAVEGVLAKLPKAQTIEAPFFGPPPPGGTAGSWMMTRMMSRMPSWLEEAGADARAKQAAVVLVGVTAIAVAVSLLRRGTGL